MKNVHNMSLRFLLLSLYHRRYYDCDCDYYNNHMNNIENNKIHRIDELTPIFQQYGTRIFSNYDNRNRFETNWSSSMFIYKFAR